MDAGACLFGGAGGSQLAAHGRLAGQIRVRIDQRELGVVVGGEHRLGQAGVHHLDVVQRLVDASAIDRLGDPGRMLVDIGEGRDEGIAVEGRGLDRLERGHQLRSAVMG